MIASKKMLYEEAALHRNQLNAVRGFSSRKSQTGESYENRDVFALATKDEMGIMVILRIRNVYLQSSKMFVPAYCTVSSSLSD